MSNRLKSEGFHATAGAMKEIAAVFEANPGVEDLCWITVGADFWHEHFLPVLAGLTESDLSVDLVRIAVLAHVGPDDS